MSIAALGKLIAAYYRTPKRAVARIWYSNETGEADVVGEYSTPEEAIEASKAEFAEFARNCEEACGEPPTCLYEQAEFIVSDTELFATLRFRHPNSDTESLYPVLVVERDGIKESFTAEAISSASG